jgi:putative cardiolipin synthase
VLASKIRLLLLLPLLLWLAACASSPAKPPCAGDQLNIADCPPANAVADADVAAHQLRRTWHKPSDLDFDPIQLGMEADIDTKPALMKIIGSSYDDSLRSLATKIWLVDNAEHTIDVMYYIFTRDMVGYGFLGALCDAVKRGVDVRVMVDSLGSINMTHSELKALENCAIDAGFVKNAKGEVTTTKARVQTVVFNAISKVFVNYNRRSHDKLLVIDGNYPDKAWVMTGGRNISLAYYGLNADGSPDPTAYMDMEILVRPAPGVGTEQSVGTLSEKYYSVIFSHKRNKRLSSAMAYKGQLEKSQQSLASLRAMPDFAAAYNTMPEYLAQLHSGSVRLAHELHNLDSKNVVDGYDDNLKRNPNSIIVLLNRISEETRDKGVMRMVSPYLFVPRYERKDGTVYYDGQEEMRKWLNENPTNRIEIITNSSLTSDNFFAQAIIDMDTAPRLLLTPEMEAQWQQKKLEQSEFNPELVESKLWQQLINNPRIQIYETGRGDSVLLGGDAHYGKLHA